MVKILITGGAGFIGASLANKLARNANFQIVAVDNLLTGFTSNLESFGNLKFIKADVNNYHEMSQILTSYKFDYVFHYAAVVGVKRTLEYPVAVLNDIQGIKNILELCKNTGVKRVFYSSSSEVYGEPIHIPQNEITTPLNSRLPYAVVKNVGESFLRSYYQEFGLEYTIFRFFNTYGKLQSKDFVVAKFLHMAANNENITVYGDGEQTRTFCYIDDNIDVAIKCIEEDCLINDVVNIGSNTLYTVNQLAEVIIEVTHSKSKITYLPPLKEGDMMRRQPDNTKMLSVLNRELKDLRTGLRLILEN